MNSDRLRPKPESFRREIAIAVGLLAVGALSGAGVAAAEKSVRDHSEQPQSLMFTESTDGASKARLRSETVGPGDQVPAADRNQGTETLEPERVPVPLGTPDRPFVPLPDDGTVRAVRTETGVMLPVLERDGGAGELSALTACENEIRLSVSEVVPIGRAHVVLDPGHGGTEVGSVGSTGLTEKDINLQVAQATKRLLEERGATVVLTREFDHNLTTAVRGGLAAAIDPALFVSIHHNGGAPQSGSQPGVMAYTKTDSADSRRFGGLFYHRFTTLLSQVAAERAEAYDRYRQVLDEYTAQIADYDRRVAEWQAGQAGPEAPTTVPPPATAVVDGVVIAVPRAEVSEVGPTPTVPEIEPVRELTFAGGGNRGVRSWIRPDGRDYLSVLRTSGDVPSVLTEFLYLTNRAEEELLLDPGFVEAEAGALTESIVDFFSGPDVGITAGYVDDEFNDQPIGGGGRPEDCVEPDYAIGER